MLKKTFILIFFLFVCSCGYQPIYSKKNIVNTSFSINELKFEGDRSINLRIKEKLNSYKLVRKDRNFTVIIKSNSDRTVIAKNLAGDPTDYQITLTVFAEILSKNGKKNSIKIEENFKYNNSTNKFNLKRYEKEILNNLAEISSDKLIFRLSNIQ
jgi:outer membrane lipopolysaccharide assembly protein LptE/RlpB|tara:strand:+ start:66 stop:530 length:465 start_codon:yes stop_codon:yes gene_type:complete